MNAPPNQGSNLSERWERQRRGQRFLDDFCLARGSDPILWVLAPLLRALYGTHPRGAGPPGESPGAPALYFETMASKVMSRVRPSGQRSRYITVGDAVFLIGGENERRSIEPILMRGSGEPEIVRSLPDPRRLRELTAASTGLAEDFVRGAADAGVGLPCAPRYLLRQFIGLSRHIAYAEGVLDIQQPRAVVVGTNHSRQARAIAQAARRRGIPSVYVPHAPMLSDPRFRDLPFDFAALRGPAEVEWYAARGAPQMRVEAIGDPGLPDVALVDIPDDAPVVVAVGPYDPELLSGLITAVARRSPDAVVVAPYPGQNRRRLRALCPRHWKIWKGRTFDLLSQGASAVIQHSSGVALESLLLGLPTIELGLRRRGAAYPVIDPEYVHFARNADDVGRALTAALQDAGSDSRRRRLQVWAQRWCAAWGTKAAEAGWRMVTRAGEAQAARPIWDAWSDEAIGETA